MRERALEQAVAELSPSDQVAGLTNNPDYQASADAFIETTMLGRLEGGGSGGAVYQVIEMHTGDHLPRKVVAVKKHAGADDDVRECVTNEMRTVRRLRRVSSPFRIHWLPHIVPHFHVQGFDTGDNINIFVPLCEGTPCDTLGSIKF
ncbi:hypothetical protein QQS21_007711 [Conoideocrella luteorostrata]|uniref:Protein kinase domain-containing protein n=1 Tax=Conoideocrella luteorostrata TaxID=1105319 RepID=A0AAJ0FRU6_9HYPO|nr:hypothetical protein QQS21_007711 [Conoideocrella luteorostrata]